MRADPDAGACLRWGVLALGLMLGLPAAGGSAPTEAPIERPRARLEAPDFSLQGLHGETLRLSAYRGRVVILNFWASFCAPCRHEMPALQRLWDRYRDRGLVVLAVAADRGDSRQVRRFVEQGGYTFPVALDPTGAVRNRYEVVVLPTTYLIARDGRFSGRALGERQWDGPAIRSLVESLLGTGVP
ncbi:MAG TPA: TlpA family protein disulfide reductase [Chromatiales bacterium]|nr:TlpA family protein disulfide reductase [Chromatiales bacterium]